MVGCRQVDSWKPLALLMASCGLVKPVIVFALFLMGKWEKGAEVVFGGFQSLMVALVEYLVL